MAVDRDFDAITEMHYKQMALEQRVRELSAWNQHKEQENAGLKKANADLCQRIIAGLTEAGLPIPPIGNQTLDVAVSDLLRYIKRLAFDNKALLAADLRLNDQVQQARQNLRDAMQHVEEAGAIVD